MNLRSKLQNPFLLVGQGFLAGAVLFFAIGPETGQARSASTMVPLQVEASVAR